MRPDPNQLTVFQLRAFRSISAAWAAAKRGCDVVGYEESDLDNQPASSGGRGKIIRFGYDDPFYAALMLDTLPRWEDLARRTRRFL